MNRRELLKYACAGTASSLGATASATTATAHSSDSLGVAWRHTYDDIAIGSATLVHGGGGYIFVNRNGRTDPEVPVRLVRVGENGAVRERQEITPDIPEDARRADTDVIRTEDGYAVATGSWFARLDRNLSVEATGFASEYEPNSTTYLTELSNGFAVASELDRPNHVSVRVFGFAKGGDLQWVREYGEENSRWLGFLLAGPDGGVVVGGQSGEPWLADIADDGTKRWQTEIFDVPPGANSDATRDGDGFTLFGGSSMVRLDTSRSVEWQRSYDSFADAFDGEIARTTDGGYVVAAQVALDRVRVGQTDAKGRLQWSHEYEVIEVGNAYLNGLVEHAPGEYLVVGSRRDVQQGWALLLSETETPTPQTTTPDRTPTSNNTETTSQKTTAPTTTATRGEPSNTSVPGFGIGAALLGTAAGWLARRR